MVKRWMILAVRIPASRLLHQYSGIIINVFLITIPLILHIGGDNMDGIKKLNKKQLAQNAYRMIVESSYSIESVALTLDMILFYCFHFLQHNMQKLFQLETKNS